MEKKKMTWGGERPGAGRPKLEQRVQVTFRVKPRTKEIFQLLRAQNFDVNGFIDDTAIHCKRLYLDKKK